MLSAGPRFVANSHSQLAEIVAAALALAFVSLPAKANAVNRLTAKERRAHADMPAALAGMRLVEVIRRERCKQRPPRELFD